MGWSSVHYDRILCRNTSEFHCRIPKMRKIFHGNETFTQGWHRHKSVTDNCDLPQGLPDILSAAPATTSSLVDSRLINGVTNRIARLPFNRNRLQLAQKNRTATECEVNGQSPLGLCLGLARSVRV